MCRNSRCPKQMKYVTRFDQRKHALPSVSQDGDFRTAVCSTSATDDFFPGGTPELATIIDSGYAPQGSYSSQGYSSWAQARDYLDCPVVLPSDRPSIGRFALA